MEMAWQILKLRQRIDAVFCTAGCYYQIPCATTVLLRKQLICASFGVDSDIARSKHGQIAAGAFALLCRWNFQLADRIVVDSPQTAEADVFRPFRQKVFLGHRFVESEFRIATPYAAREKIIGFIGRVSEEKGISAFVDALPQLLESDVALRVFIVGSGSSDPDVQRKLDSLNRPDRIRWIRWVDHRDIPEYLNRLRLLVVPSATEGIPNIILEAMACGTLVLATPVGGIPTLIRDGISGFFLKDVSVESLCRMISACLAHPDPEGILAEARKVIDGDYSLEVCTERYRKILFS
jgi:glycosyltransferase involved in cell wall biosynthesis